MHDHFDVILVGTSFASSFFLSAYLEHAKADARVLVLERGRQDTHAWQLRNRNPRHTVTSSLDADGMFVNNNPGKPWVHHPSFGGASNSWWACTPRFMPNDFSLQSTYGVGTDWPVRYDALETFYHQVETAMQVSGPDAGSPYPRSKPYPQPPHRFTDPDKELKEAFPDLFFQQPNARARMGTKTRPMCCASGVCHLCPINSKFTISNEMSGLYQDPRVTMLLEATVQSVETSGSVASGVAYEKDNTTHTARGDLIALGAGALFNPHILLRSGLHHPLLGKHLHEQVSTTVTVDLDGVDNFQGSTSITGHGYMFYDGAHRAQHAGCLIETWNIPNLRAERGKWRQRLDMKLIFEVIPTEDSYVTINKNNPDLPETVYAGHSAYTQRAIAQLPKLVEKVVAPLPVERIHLPDNVNSTEGHILGTTVMGDDPVRSIVDRHLVHHKIRNLVVLGGGAFPTSSPANPTLTLSALSLWSAHKVFGS